MKRITILTAVSMVALLLLSAIPASAAILEVSSLEMHGPIYNSSATPVNVLTYNSSDLPMFYSGLDSTAFSPGTNGESLLLNFTAAGTIADNGIVYTSTKWQDNNLNWNIAWLGEKYFVVGNDVTKLSKYLVDFKTDEKMTIKQGDVWDIGEGFTLTVQDIDINGQQVWLAFEQDGSSIADIIAFAGTTEYWNTTLAGTSDVPVAKFTVEKVFAGMTANMAILNDSEIISMDVTELDADKYHGLEFSNDANNLTLTETDGTTSLAKGKTYSIIGDFLKIRTGDVAGIIRLYVYREVQVGEPVTTGPKPTGAATEEPTVDVNATVAPTTVGTAAPTTEVVETPTPKPTKEPGFEAVFAIAGLLAVAYLVLRKRE